jgi:transposase
MAGRPKANLELTETQRQELERMARARTSEKRMVFRARLILECATGADNVQVAKTLGTSQQTVTFWRVASYEKGWVAWRSWLAAGVQSASSRRSKADNAVVLCCDEKSQCQALQRSQPGLPLGQGHLRTVTHDYYRHGTVTLFAALDYLSGKVISQVAPRRRHNEWLKFLKKLDSEITEDLSIHLIVYNYSTHKHQKVRRWLERHPRFHLHFTPTSASWMNMVERFFRDLSQQAILPSSFGSVAELVDTINLYLAQHNLEPKRYVWHADGQEVLNKINRAWEAATNPAIY